MAPPGGLRVAKPFAERVKNGKGKLIRGALALLLNWLVIAWWMHYRHHSMEAQRPVDVHKAPPPRPPPPARSDSAPKAAPEAAPEAAPRARPRPPPAERPRAAAAARSDPYATNETLVLGAERCAAFRAANPKLQRRFAPAGLFNSATNALWRTVLNNCRLTANGRHDLFMTPWGKHNPASWRGKHTAKMFSNASVLQWAPRLDSVLPLVIVKDPLTWMPSTCRHPYAVRLHPAQKQSQTCPSPHLAKPVSVAFQADRVLRYDSLPALWRDWHAEYYDAPYPRLMLRSEDLLFDPAGVARTVCDCLGGDLAAEADFVIEGGKKGVAFGHAQDTKGRRDALAFYGDATRRFENYAPGDLAFVAAALGDFSPFRYFRYDRGVS